MLGFVVISMECILDENLTTETYMTHSGLQCGRKCLVPLDGKLPLASRLLDCAPHSWIGLSKST